MYRCNLTMNIFERPVSVRSDEYGDESLCPCCHDTDWDTVVECDICHKDTVDRGENRLSTGTVVCPDCKRSAIVTLFEHGAKQLGIYEEDYLDDLLEIGYSWEDMRGLYREAKKNAETVR